MIDIFFYYYYLFYKNILKESDPIEVAILVLGFIISLVPINLIMFSLVYFFEIKLHTLYYFFAVIGVDIILLKRYYKKRYCNKIIKSKPILFNSHRKTVYFVTIISLTIFSFLFWGPIVYKKLSQIASY